MNMMKKVTAVILILMILISLVACGGKADNKVDPNLGMWKAISATLEGETMEAKELFDEGVLLELKAKGKYILIWDGDTENGKWSYKDGKLVITRDEGEFTGSIKNGILILKNVADSGMDIFFEKEGGKMGTSIPKKSGDVGYYVLVKGIEDGETFLSDDLKEMGLDNYYVLLNKDGTAACYSDEYATGTWEKGVLTLYTEELGTGTFEYELKGDELSIDWGGLILVYLRSDDTPPEPPETNVATNESSEIKEWWDGDWYGYWETHSESKSYEEFQGGQWQCYVNIKMDDDERGTIYLWGEGGDLATTQIYIDKDAGTGKMGAAISISGDHWDGMEIEYGNFTIDPGSYEYENYIVIDARYVDNYGEGFNYIAYLRPWGQLWDEIPKEKRPLWYEQWYLPAYSVATMNEAILDHDGPIHTGIANASSTEKTVNSQVAVGSISDVSGKIVNAGNISALCPDGWKSYGVPDYFSDDIDANSKNGLKFQKGAKSLDDQFLTPGLEIQYYEHGLSPDDPENHYEGKTEKWGPIKLGKYTWKGYIGHDEGLAFLWTNTGSQYSQITVQMNLEEEGKKISIDDADVLAIINSIKLP